ncbi:ImmA/IrrE family metallo-endopeptidase [Pseudocolwellia sp. HL-MZ19]|uniref:ImmA/IrrE family metallo-endopeptidase n=1 Tax=Pseudocolwellia sp. HL-MZ19 TaxID=3400846 RepID=UPI003CEC6306
MNSGKPWVDLQSLIDLCWSNGIPVLHIPKLPTSSKMDAVAIEVAGRPVIFLTKNDKHESWLLFHLAHEIGHVIAGHLEGGDMLVDIKIDGSDTEEHEQEANKIAFEIIIGSGPTNYGGETHGIKAIRLAEEALSQGKKDKVDPGHIILNWGYTTGIWGVASGALNYIFPDPQWKSFFIEKLLNNLDEDTVSEDSLEYLYKLTCTDD